MTPSPFALAADSLDVDEPEHVALPDSPGALAAQLTKGREEQRPHLDLIDRELMRCTDQGGQRIIINIGPRYGKTQRVKWGILHRLSKLPDSRVIYASHGASLAEDASRWVRDQLEAHPLGPRPRRDSRAVDRWWIQGQRGGMLAAGIGGGITGFGADLLVIDDVIKDAEQALSQAWRDKVWRWYTQTAFDRLEPDASVVIVMTRWHEDDLTGRLLREQPGVWTVIRVATVAEAGDPLQRKPGELLWPERYDETAVAEQRATLGAYAFSARHQQQPTKRAGGVWQEDWVRDTHRDGVIDALQLAPTLEARCVALDPSASEEPDGDEAGIVAAGRRADGMRFVLADLSGLLTPDAWGRRTLVAAAELDCDIVYESNLTPVFIRRTLKQAWTALVNEAKDSDDGMVDRVLGVGRVELPGLMPMLKPVRAKVGKLLRAEPVAQLYEQRLALHCRPFEALEGQQLTWRPTDTDSPDRLDAAVHAITWLGDAAGPVTMSSATGRASIPRGAATAAGRARVAIGGARR